MMSFHLNFQPKIDLRTGKINAMEALIRWNHPALGKIDPKAFIEIAESTGFIETIGDWVMQKACQQAKVWAHDGVDGVRCCGEHIGGPAVFGTIQRAIDGNIGDDRYRAPIARA